MNRAPVIGLTALNYESPIASCLAVLERGVAREQERYRQRLIAHAEMRNAIRKTAPQLNAPKSVSKLKNASSNPPRRRHVMLVRDLSAAELDHAERLLGEGYALSKVAYMLDTTQSSIERGLRARKGAA